MSVVDLASGLLMVLGTAALVLACLGASLARGGLVRLHYVSAAAVLGAPVLILGVLLHDPGDWFKLLLIASLLAGTSPVTSAATARALARRGHVSGAVE